MLMSMFSAPTSSCDLLQDLDPHFARDLEVRAARRAEAEHEFARVDLRKQFGAQVACRPSHKHQAADGQVQRHDHRTPDRLVQATTVSKLACTRSNSPGFLSARVVLPVMLQQPYANDRHQRAG